MFQQVFKGTLLGAATVVAATLCSAQIDIQLRVGQQPGWDPRAREGHCVVTVWVDNRVEVRMRGDHVYLRTLEGSRGHVEGSQCSQPIPYGPVRNFEVRQTAGRSRVSLTQEPGRLNNYTALFTIEDRQGGGDNYAFEVKWMSEAAANGAPSAFFDEVRACQDVVRKRFLSQNGRGAYLDFDQFADRQGRNFRGGERRGQENELIQGRGSARSRYELRDLTYSCVIDTQRSQVVSGTYQLTRNDEGRNGHSRMR